VQASSYNGLSAHALLDLFIDRVRQDDLSEIPSGPLPTGAPNRDGVG